MRGFDLPKNFVDNPESLARKTRPRVVVSPQEPTTSEPASSAPSTSTLMAERTLRDYSAPSVANVPIGPNVDAGAAGLDIKSSLITMVQAIPFCGKASEDANSHLQQFLEICNTSATAGVNQDAIRLRLFPLSLLGKAKQWFYANRASIDTWNKCSTAFLAKFFPMGKTNALRGRIASFQQATNESMPEAWERLQEYILACPHHGMEEWLILQHFYNGLTPTTRGHMDAAAGGAFFSKTIAQAKELIEKMVSNQGWSDDRLQTRSRGVHPVKEVDMLSAKVDLLIKRLDEHNANGGVHALDSHMTCEECGNTGHMGKDCPHTHEEAFYMNNNNGYRPNGGQGYNQNRPSYQGGNNFSGFNNNQPSLKDLVYGQAKINESINKKLAANDKVLENITAQIEGFSSAFKNQLSFNKMIETQVAQLAALIPGSNSGKIPGQPESSLENVNAVTTRGGKSTRDPPYPNHAAKKNRNEPEEESPSTTKEKEEEPKPSDGKNGIEFQDTSFLPFPHRNRKPKEDEQFARFVETIRRIHVNVPLLDMVQVPTYARYLKDILNNKRPLPNEEMVKLTEECSAAILNRLPEKKKDPGCPTISCSIGAHHFDQALCDLGASVSVMPKEVFDRLSYTTLTPTPMRLQLADSSVRYPAGIAEDVPVKIRGNFIPVDFVVLEMDIDKNTPLILGRPFLSTANAQIDVGNGEIRFHINGKEEKFEFQPRKEQCSMIKIKYGPNPSNIREVEVTPRKTDSLVAFWKQLDKIENPSWYQPKKPATARPGLWAKKPVLQDTKPPTSTKTKQVWQVKKVQPSSSSSPGKGPAPQG